MSDTLLATSGLTTAMLSRRPTLARAVGSSSERSVSFHEADEADRFETALEQWRGLDNRLLFAPRPVSPKLPSWGDLNGRGWYDPRPLEDFRGIESPGDQQLRSPRNLGIEQSLRDDDQEAVQARARVHPGDRVLLGGSVVNRILYEGDAPELGRLVAGDDRLREGYVEGPDDARTKAQSLIAEYAEEATQAGFTSEEWLREGELARLLIENRGGLADRIADDPEALKTLQRGTVEQLLDDARGRSRERVLEQLSGETGELLDEEFFTEHPLAALDLLVRPAERERINEDLQAAESYAANVAEVEERMASELGQRANDEVSAAPFNYVRFSNELPADPADWYADGEDPFELVTWLDANPRIAEVVVADAASEAEDALGDWLNSDRGYEFEEELFAPDVIARYWADRADEATGGALPRHLFDNSVALSLFTARDGELAAGLAADAEAIRAAYPDPDSTDESPLSALRGYALGLAERRWGDYARIA